MLYSECCGAIVYDDYDICSECLEHGDVWDDEDGQEYQKIMLDSYWFLSVYLVIINKE